MYNSIVLFKVRGVLSPDDASEFNGGAVEKEEFVCGDVRTRELVFVKMTFAEAVSTGGFVKAFVAASCA